MLYADKITRTQVQTWSNYRWTENESAAVVKPRNSYVVFFIICKKLFILVLQGWSDRHLNLSALLILKKNHNHSHKSLPCFVYMFIFINQAELWEICWSHLWKWFTNSQMGTYLVSIS